MNALRPRNPAYRRYLGRMGGAGAVYLVVIFIAAKVLHTSGHPVPASVLSIGLALLPGVAVLAMIWAIGRLLVELDDEYLRMLEVRKALVATAVTLAASSVWGLLELFTDVPRVPIFWVFPAWCLGLTLGAMVNRATLGDGGCA